MDSAEAIWTLTHDPMLRWQDVPGGAFLAEQAILNPDPHMQELVGLVAQAQRGIALVSADPFWPNYPPAGQMPAFVPGRIPIAVLPASGELLSLPASDLTRNVLLCGPTGSGKTTWLRLAILASLGVGNARPGV